MFNRFRVQKILKHDEDKYSQVRFCACRGEQRNASKDSTMLAFRVGIDNRNLFFDDASYFEAIF